MLKYKNKEYLYTELIIKKRPISSLAKELEIPYSTLKYHLKLLKVNDKTLTELRKELKTENILTPDVLYNEFVLNKKTPIQIAEHFYLSPRIVRILLRKNGYRVNKWGRTKKELLQMYNKDYFYDLYINQKLSAKEIANLVGSSENIIWKVLKTNKIQVRETSGTEIFTNQKYGKLLPLNRDYTKNNLGYKDTSIYWKCQCDCGKFYICKASDLFHKRKTSCGCYNNKHFGEISFRFWHRIREGAEKRCIDFHITIEDIWNLFIKQNGKCAISGIDLVLTKNPKPEKITTASLDRIDSSKGYKIDNIQWVHKDLNRMKLDMEEKNFFKWIKTIYEYKKLSDFI